MATHNAPQSASQITAEAAAWLAQLESGHMSPDDLTAFREWVNRSPRHASEIRDFAALSGALCDLTDLAEPLATVLTDKRPARRVRRSPAFIFATVAAACMLAVLGYWQLADRSVHAFYVTDVGQYRTVALPDGSSVKLNTNSAVEVEYDGNTRRVRLGKGEAFFDVAKDRSRPFIVYAGAHYARAVGTAFVVRLLDKETELVVTKGTVEFAKVTAPDTAAPIEPKTEITIKPALVTAGYQVTSLAADPDDDKAVKLSPRAQERKLSWTEGLFDFSDAPLSQVVTEVTRHTNIRIEIADARLKDVKFGGVFRIGDIDSLLESLPRVGVAVERVDDHTVLLRRAGRT